METTIRHKISNEISNVKSNLSSPSLLKKVFLNVWVENLQQNRSKCVGQFFQRHNFLGHLSQRGLSGTNVRTIWTPSWTLDMNLLEPLFDPLVDSPLGHIE